MGARMRIHSRFAGTLDVVPHMTEATSYDADFHAWALRNAELLRQGRLDESDIEADLDAHLLPVDCPYALVQILDEDWLPED